MSYKNLQPNFFKETVFAQILIVVIVVVFTLFMKFPFTSLNNDVEPFATISLKIDSTQRTFEGEVTKDMTVLNSLNIATNAGKIEFNYFLDKHNNVTIVRIGDHANGMANKFFIFYLNSKSLNSSDLNKETIKSGD